MPIPPNIIATADDLGLNNSINQAILFCFENEYINSTSFLTNTVYFEETLHLIYENSAIHNIGVHINLAEGKPVTNFKHYYFLNEEGNWDINKVSKKQNIFSRSTRDAFFEEIAGQIDKVLSKQVLINHIDSHYHLHTLPCFFNLFREAAKHYKLKLRLAQSYYEGSVLSFFYRKYINSLLKSNNINYSDCFESVTCFLKKNIINDKIIEIMLHPDFKPDGKLIDHFDANSITKWIFFLDKLYKKT